MRTTLDLPDPLMRRVRIRAASEGRKLTDLIAELLEAGLARRSAPPLPADRQPYEIDPQTGFPVARQIEPAGFVPPTPGQVQALIDQAHHEEDLHRGGMLS